MDVQQSNPFQPPQAELQQATTQQSPLYSVAGVGLATFIGTPLAGAVFAIEVDGSTAIAEAQQDGKAGLHLVAHQHLDLGDAARVDVGADSHRICHGFL